MENIQTLHAHTRNSDGELTHLQVLDICEQNGISVVAFTDHDSLIDERSLEELKKYKGKTKWISGIEICSGLPQELGGKATSDLHIVGLFVNPQDEKLKRFCVLARKTRRARVQKMISNLQSLGFDITENDCLTTSDREAIGRPHIVAALVSKKNNLKLLLQLKQKMQKAAKEDLEIKEKYDAMMEQGEKQYPYTILLSSNAYIPHIYVNDKYFLDMDASIKLIRDAGGVAILAHYFSCAKKITEDLLDQMLRDNRIDGAEVVCGLSCHNTSTEIERTVIKTSDIVSKLVKKHNKLVSGGADAHTSQDFVDFVNSGDYAKKTSGIAERMIKQSNVDTTWSNF